MAAIVPDPNAWPSIILAAVTAVGAGGLIGMAEKLAGRRSARTAVSTGELPVAERGARRIRIAA